MLETIKETLRTAGLTVYDSAEKVGECRAPYVVCYDGGVEVQPRRRCFVKGVFSFSEILRKTVRVRRIFA